MGRLSGKDALDLFEIVLESENVQYRPLVCYGPKKGELTILCGATKKGKKGSTQWNPSNAIAVAQRRKQLIANQGRTCEHSISEP
jgi:hypothetical protein